MRGSSCSPMSCRAPVHMQSRGRSPTCCSRPRGLTRASLSAEYDPPSSDRCRTSSAGNCSRPYRPAYYDRKLIDDSTNWPLATGLPDARLGCGDVHTPFQVDLIRRLLSAGQANLHGTRLDGRAETGAAASRSHRARPREDVMRPFPCTGSHRGLNEARASPCVDSPRREVIGATPSDYLDASGCSVAGLFGGGPLASSVSETWLFSSAATFGAVGAVQTNDGCAVPGNRWGKRG